MNNIAIIPARSGSKGLKDKNILDLCGKPLMAYTIEAAIESNEFDTIMVSTDSEKYANIAIEYGADVPFLRSSITSSDTASSWDVVREVLEKYKENKHNFSTFALLQPTSPLRNASDIKNAYIEFHKLNAISLTSVCEARYSPVNCNILPEDHSMDGFYGKNIELSRRQDLPAYYHENGAIYIGDVEYFLKFNDFYSSQCYAFIMAEYNSIDIDSELDFKYAELLMH